MCHLAGASAIAGGDDHGPFPREPGGGSIGDCPPPPSQFSTTSTMLAHGPPPPQTRGSRISHPPSIKEEGVGSIHQLSAKVGEFERIAAGALVEVGGSGMAAVDILVIEELEAHRPHLRRHLA